MNLQTTDWDKFKIFYFVAKSLSLTKAAQNLNISQPSLSRSIINLEYHLKTRLFKRDAKGMIPTEEGQHLFETVSTVFEELSRYQQSLQNYGEEPQGKLTFTIARTLPTVGIINLVTNFLEIYPKLKLNFIECNEQLNLNNNQADVAIRTFDDEAKNLEQIYLRTFKYGLYASPTYIEKNGPPQSIEDLCNHNFIAYDSYTERHNQNVNWFLNLGMVKNQYHEPHMQFNSASSLLTAAYNGIGIVSLPQGCLEAENALIRILPNVESPAVDLYYVYPTFHKKCKKVTAFRDYLVEKLKF